MSLFLGGKALLFFDPLLIGGLEFDDMSVVMSEEKIHRNHLLWRGIPKNDLAGRSSGREIRDSWSWLALERGLPIQIVDGGHAHELPDFPVRCGQTADSCDEAPVSGGPEDDWHRLSLRLIVDESASWLTIAAVDGRAYTEKPTLLIGF